MRHLFIATLFVVIVEHASLYASVKNVPANYVSIQSALNACSTGDTVLVQPGIYYEHIVWPNLQGITLLAAGDSSNCIIDGSNTGRVINIVSTPASNSSDPYTVIKGFKIQNGKLVSSGSGGWLFGAGISVNRKNFSLQNCWIENNRSVDSASVSAWCYGGGMYIDGVRVLLSKSVFTNNVVTKGGWNYGGALYLSKSSASPDSVVIDRCVFKNNEASDEWRVAGAAIYAEAPVNLYLQNSLFYNNHGGGSNLNVDGSAIYNEGSLLNINHCTIANNTQLTQSSSILLTGSAANPPVITNSIIWDGANSLVSTSAIDAAITVSNCDIVGGHAGNSNINSSPQFVSALDYHLQCSSPCINNGSTVYSSAFDLDGLPHPTPLNSNPDMGCYEANQTFSPVMSTGGPTSFCTGDSVLLSAGMVNGATYQWKKNGTNISGATALQYTAKQTGSYSFDVSMGNCVLPSAVVQVSVENSYASITCSADTLLCEGEHITLFAQTGNGVSYSWLNNGNIIAATSSPKYQVTETGLYSVSTTTANCVSVGNAIHIIVYSLPATPVIYQSHDTLFSSSPINNQWQSNSVNIPGAVRDFYVPDVTGIYKVIVTDSGDCSSESIPFSFLYNSVATTCNSYFRVIQNPVNETLLISAECDSRDFSDTRIEIYSYQGQRLLSINWDHIQKITSVDVSKFSSGLYILCVKNNTDMFSKKLLIQH